MLPAVTTCRDYPESRFCGKIACVKTLRKGVTLFMPLEDALKWDERYSTPKGPKSQDEFLTSCMEYLPPGGLALDVAMGEGRNSIFLAQNGWRVIGLDISRVGVGNAVKKARDLKLHVAAAVVDLTRWWLPSSYFDLVVNIRYLERTLVPQIRRSLKPGGYVLFRTLALKPDYEFGNGEEIGFSLSFLLQPGELIEWFGDYEIIAQSIVEAFSEKKPFIRQEALLAKKPFG